MLRKRKDHEGCASPAILPLCDLLFHSHCESLRKLVLTLKVINKYTEWNVWCYPMSSLDFHEAWSGLLVTELNWACMRTCEMLVKDILGKWCILVPGKERRCVWAVVLWGFALISVISWYPQKGRRRRETSLRDWELSQARKQNLNEGKTWVAQESCSTSHPQPQQQWVSWLRSCAIECFW